MGATASTCTTRSSAQGSEASGYSSATAGEGQEPRTGRRLSKRTSRIDPEAMKSPVFTPAEGLQETDIEFMNGLVSFGQI